MAHPMDPYVFDRLLIDAEHVIALARQQKAVSHPGLKGRFRELLIDGILQPWLPVTVQCATGTVVSFHNTYRSRTQDDILLVDSSISPSILLKPHVQEGIYLRNSVLSRIEVKSSLDNTGFGGFVESCREYHQLGLDLDNERAAAKRISIKEINNLFAFESEVKRDTLCNWFRSVTDGSISVVCAIDHGLWRITSDATWLEYDCETEKRAPERLAAFVGLMSNTAFGQHVAAQGRDRLASLEGGIGQYFNRWTPLK